MKSQQKVSQDDAGTEPLKFFFEIRAEFSLYFYCRSKIAIIFANNISILILAISFLRNSIWQLDSARCVARNVSSAHFHYYYFSNKFK